MAAEQAAAQAILDLKVDADIMSLADAAVDPIASTRVDYLRRYIKLTKHAAAVMLSVNVPDVPDVMVDLSNEALAWHSFADTSLRDRWQQMDHPTFLANIHDSKTLSKWLWACSSVRLVIGTRKSRRRRPC
jgi:hypothetical protein